MTLRADLITLLADASIIDVDVNEAVADEHLRSSTYQRIVSVVAASGGRDGDRAIVSAMVRDPIEMVARTAVVDLVDKVAMRTTRRREFERWWSTQLLPELGRLQAEGNRQFIRRRVQDWMCYLSIREGHVPTPVELAGVTDWMQRRIAAESTALPVLALLAEFGGTKKIRNIAKNRAGSREPRTN